MGQEPEEVRIGVIAYATGEYATASGEPTIQGAELAAKLINDVGGLTINNRTVKVTLVIEDVGGRPS